MSYAQAPALMNYRFGLSLHVTVNVAPKNITPFFEAFKPVYEKVIAEPKNLFFEVYQSVDFPGKITWVENWNGNPDWFMQDQITKDYYKDYLAITEPMFTKPREGEFFERTGSEYDYKGNCSVPAGGYHH
ncbi:hypothetical protein F4808DRAFT_455792 [Astrocystis sublimbata]|nr:hypothetical protein F4808DRAFT_455792 [Astrocystis sublimbata]